MIELWRTIPVFVLAFTASTFLAAQQEGSPRGQEGSAKEGSGPAGDHEPVLVLKGLDPVLLVQGKEKKGKEEFEVVHHHHRYLFESAQNKQAFEEKPEKYAVSDHGYCPVARVKMNREVMGSPEIFAVHEGKVYLFADADARKLFEADPGQYAPVRKREGS